MWLAKNPFDNDPVSPPNINDPRDRNISEPTREDEDITRRNFLRNLTIWIWSAVSAVITGAAIYDYNKPREIEKPKKLIDIDEFKKHDNQTPHLHKLDRKNINITPTWALAWPLKWDFAINSVYGFRKSKGRDHNGRDLNTPTGTPVYAPAGGTVVLSTWQSNYSWVINNIVNFFWSDVSDGYWNYIVIDHKDGLYTLYGHLDERKVAVDDIIEEWDLIALTWNTWSSTWPHLHFEIRKWSNSHSKSVSPAEFYDIVIKE